MLWDAYFDMADSQSVCTPRLGTFSFEPKSLISRCALICDTDHCLHNRDDGRNLQPGTTFAFEGLRTNVDSRVRRAKRCKSACLVAVPAVWACMCHEQRLSDRVYRRWVRLMLLGACILVGTTLPAWYATHVTGRSTDTSSSTSILHKPPVSAAVNSTRTMSPGA